MLQNTPIYHYLILANEARLWCIVVNLGQDDAQASAGTGIRLSAMDFVQTSGQKMNLRKMSKRLDIFEIHHA